MFLIISIMTYVSSIWRLICKSSMYSLSRLHSKLVRIICNAFPYLPNIEMRKEFNASTFRKRVVDCSTKFYKTLYTFPNEIIAELSNFETDHRKRPKYFIIKDIDGPEFSTPVLLYLCAFLHL